MIGKQSLALQGISHCLGQIEQGIGRFQRCVSLDQLIADVDSDESDAAEKVIESINSDDEDDDDDDIVNEPNILDENTICVREEIVGGKKYELATDVEIIHHVYTVYFPREFGSHIVERMTDRNASLFVSLIFANTFFKMSMNVDDTNTISDAICSLTFNSLHNGNIYFDRYNQPESRGILKLNKVCDCLLEEDITAEIESVSDMSVENPDSISCQLGTQLDILRSRSEYVSAIFMSQHRSTVFVFDPLGGIMFLDSNLHGPKGVFLSWTKSGTITQMITSVTPVINNDNNRSSLAVVSFGS